MADAGTLPEFRLERMFDAPREVVWAAWTQAARLERWFGPKGCTAKSVRFDFRPGGMTLTRLEYPGMPPMHARFIYRKIEAPHVLEWLHAVADETGKASKHPMAQALPEQMLVRMTLEEAGGRTKLILVKTPFEATAEEAEAFAQMLDSFGMGWTGNFDVLDEHLAGRR